MHECGQKTLKTTEDIFTSGLPAWHCRCSAGGSAHLPGWKNRETPRDVSFLRFTHFHKFSLPQKQQKLILKNNNQNRKWNNNQWPRWVLFGRAPWCEKTTIFLSLLSHHLGIWNTVSTDHHFSLPPVPVLASAVSQHTDTSKNTKATLNVMCCTATRVTTFTHGKLHARQNPLSTMDINWAEDSVTWQ